MLVREVREEYKWVDDDYLRSEFMGGKMKNSTLIGPDGPIAWCSEQMAYAALTPRKFADGLRALHINNGHIEENKKLIEKFLINKGYTCT